MNRIAPSVGPSIGIELSHLVHGSHPMHPGQLTLEEERGLAWAVLNDQCPIARDRLVKAHAALVVAIASRFANRGLSFLDLIQEGHSGLRRAVDGFDPAQGIRLSTWASWWIKHSIRSALAEAARTVQVCATVPGRWNQAGPKKCNVRGAGSRPGGSVGERPDGRGRADPHPDSAPAALRSTPRLNAHS